MTELFDYELEAGVKALHGLGWSISVIIKHFKDKGVSVSRGKVSNIINNKGAKRQMNSIGAKFNKSRVRTVRTKQLIKRVETESSKENPPTQRALASRFGCALSTINGIIHRDLKLQTRKKPKVHKLTELHIQKRFMRCKFLHDTEVTEDKLEYCVTLDEAWLALNDCNRSREICYVQQGCRVPDEWVFERDQNFGTKIMAVAVLTGRGAGPIFFVPPKVKISASFYVDFVLKPLIEKYLPEIYPEGLVNVWVHHDAASSHTCAATQNYIEQVSHKTGIRFIKNDQIPVKSPDCSPLDFFGFGYLKGKLAKRRISSLDGLKRAAKEEWRSISDDTVTKVFYAWRHRLKMIVSKRGKHIENVKNLHNKSTAQYS